MGEDPGGTPRRWPWVLSCCVVIASTIVAVLVAAGQTSSDEVRADPSEHESDESLDDLAVRTANNPIVGGFVVAEGTTVPGGAFPGRGGTYAGQEMETWSFLVTPGEHLSAAVDAYVEQARSLGFAGPGTPGEFCDVTPPGARFGPDGVEIPVPADAPPRSLVCGAYGQRLVDGRAEVVEIAAERTYGDEFPIDEMAVTFVRYPPGVGLPFPEDTGADETTAGPAGPTSTPWTDWTGGAPTVSTVPTRMPEDCGPSIAVPDGARPVGGAFSCGLHYGLVYDVSRDPDAFEQFGEQIRTSPGFNEWTYQTSDIELEGRPGRVGVVSSDDSTSLTVTLLEEHVGRPAVLRIDYVNGT